MGSFAERCVLDDSAKSRLDSQGRVGGRSGELGSRLPTEAELQQQYSVGGATAQRALTELAQAGLVERHRRRGSFVTEGVFSRRAGAFETGP
ncbi:GntR family transcriptional regulator [Streptomyces sp. NPDC051664]|uniref:GntR family transcriptional regulator n=1 Tax=Streptomyces sp. NPDC051664 TaxID=3365668 RepID=UPI0037A294D1